MEKKRRNNFQSSPSNMLQMQENIFIEEMSLKTIFIGNNRKKSHSYMISFISNNSI